MGVYADHIFPLMMESGLGSALHRRYRQQALGGARGQVLEIGFGTGLNLLCYPPEVERLVGLDSASVLQARVRRRIAAAPFPVERLKRDAADRLPFPDEHFDTVVSTWTLCSIARLRAALRELGRVLRPEGEFLFLEHGLADGPVASRLQNALNPLQNLVACGCNLNRKIDDEIEGAGFRISTLERFHVPGVPRTLGTVYLGSASRGGV